MDRYPKILLFVAILTLIMFNFSCVRNADWHEGMQYKQDSIVQMALLLDYEYLQSNNLHHMDKPVNIESIINIEQILGDYIGSVEEENKRYLLKLSIQNGNVIGGLYDFPNYNERKSRFEIKLVNNTIESTYLGRGQILQTADNVYINSSGNNKLTWSFKKTN